MKFYEKKKNTGRPSALTKREERVILRAASNSCLTTRKIAQEIGIKTNIRNVRHIIQMYEHFVLKKIQRKLLLISRYKMDHLNFAKDYVLWKRKWQSVIFFDKKRFNLDSLDGFNLSIILGKNNYQKYVGK